MRMSRTKRTKVRARMECGCGWFIKLVARVPSDMADARMLEQSRYARQALDTHQMMCEYCLTSLQQGVYKPDLAE